MIELQAVEVEVVLEVVKRLMLEVEVEVVVEPGLGCSSRGTRSGMAAAAAGWISATWLCW